MQELLNAVAQWVIDLLSVVWQWVNFTMVKIIDGALFLWPSTPDELKFSTMIQRLYESVPGAPWWILGDLMRSSMIIITIGVTWKILKMVRG